MRFIAVFAVCILLGGCLAVQSKVTRFHEIPAAEPVTERTFAFFPSKEQEDSLEYKTYEAALRTELARVGFREVPFIDAWCVVMLKYGINEREIAVSMPVWGQTGTRTVGGFGTISQYGNVATYSGTTTTVPTYGVAGYRASTDTVYKRVLGVAMFEGPSRTADSKTGKPKMLFDGRVVSEGSSGSLATVLPVMMKALFQEFPGKNGETVTVTLPLDRK